MWNPVQLRSGTERDSLIRTCLLTLLHVRDLCDMVAHYASEFQGIRYDPVRSAQLACDQTVDDWLRCGPLSIDVLRLLVSQYAFIDPEDHPTHQFHGPLCVLPDGRLASGSWDRDASVWSGVKLLTMNGMSSTSAFATSPCGSKLAIGSISGLVRVCDVVAETCQTVTERSRASVLAMAFLTDGRLAVGSSFNDVRVWDLDRMVCVWVWTPTSFMASSMFALIPLDHGKFASASGDKAVRLWDIDRAIVQTLVVHRGPVYVLLALPGGLMASGSSDRKVIIMDVTRGLCVRRLEGHSHSVCSLAELPAGRLASGSLDYTVRMWHVKTGVCLFELTGHAGPVRALAVLPDGKLASGSSDQTVRVWDEDGTCVHVLEAHTRGVAQLVVLPQGQLVSGGYDSKVYFWM